MNNLISNQSGVIFANCNFNYKPYSLLAFAFLLFAFNSFAQNRLVLNNDVYAVIKNNAFIVINNSSTNAITTMGSGGNIISEGEFNTVKWCIGTATGSYTVPFAKSYGNKMPLIVNITKPGGGSGSILFSTFGGDWNNELYHPSSVTNMVNSVGDNNSNKVIDRFWIIEANGYTSKPSASITFSYLEAEWSATGNSISEANLQAQSFNSSIAPNGTWWNSIPQGTASTVPNSVTNVAVNIANFFRTWTLVDGNFPLPIELLSFTATCNTASQSFNNSVTLKWTTSSETNNDFFVLEKSIDAINFDSIATIKGSGNSHDSTNYNYSYVNNDFTYYRLKQTDFDGKFTYSDIVYANCNDNIQANQQDNLIEIVNIYPNPAHSYLNYIIYSYEDSELFVSVIDVLGNVIISKNETISKGLNYQAFDISALASAPYFLKVQTINGLNKEIKQIIVE